MSQATKTALSEALIKLLSEKTLDKITISDITDQCGLNRQTFYYHFHDVFELVEWTYRSAAEEALGENRTYSTWQEGYCALLEHQTLNRAFVMNTFTSISRESLERALSGGLEALLSSEIDRLSAGKNVTEADRRMLTRFFALGFTGLTIDWLAAGMKPEPEDYTAQISNVLSGSIMFCIERCNRREQS